MELLKTNQLVLAQKVRIIYLSVWIFGIRYICEWANEHHFYDLLSG